MLPICPKLRETKRMRRAIRRSHAWHAAWPKQAMEAGNFPVNWQIKKQIPDPRRSAQPPGKTVSRPGQESCSRNFVKTSPANRCGLDAIAGHLDAMRWTARADPNRFRPIQPLSVGPKRVPE